MGNALRSHEEAVMQRHLRRRQIDGEQLVFENKETMERLYESRPVIVSGATLSRSTSIVNPFGNAKVDQFEAKYFSFLAEHKDQIVTIDQRMNEVRKRIGSGEPTEDDLEKIAMLQDDMDLERASLKTARGIYRKLKSEKHVHELAELAQSSQTARSQIARSAKGNKNRIDKAVKEEGQLDDLRADSRDLVSEIIDIPAGDLANASPMDATSREKALRYLKSETREPHQLEDAAETEEVSVSHVKDMPVVDSKARVSSRASAAIAVSVPEVVVHVSS